MPLKRRRTIMLRMEEGDRVGFCETKAAPASVARASCPRRSGAVSLRNPAISPAMPGTIPARNTTVKLLRVEIVRIVEIYQEIGTDYLRIGMKVTRRSDSQGKRRSIRSWKSCRRPCTIPRPGQGGEAATEGTPGRGRSGGIESLPKEMGMPFIPPARMATRTLFFPEERPA